MTALPFGDRLRHAVGSTSSLCVGIDPHRYLLGEWGLDDSPAGLEEFAMAVVDAADGLVGVLKPQVAFFERHGSRGIAVLERIIADARSRGFLVIADAKRGDVGTSVAAYGEAWLTPGSPLESDALTVSAFQGFGSLEDVTATADAAGKGLFVLAATSNPEAAVIQQATTASGGTVARQIVDDVIAWNADRSNSDGTATPWGSIGLVLGATLNLAEFGIELDSLVGTPILAPGFGHQGANFGEVGELFGPAAPTVLVSASRSILRAGPEGLRPAITHHVEAIGAAS